MPRFSSREAAHSVHFNATTTAGRVALGESVLVDRSREASLTPNYTLYGVCDLPDSVGLDNI